MMSGRACDNSSSHILGPVVDAPLALCDSQTLMVSDLLETTDTYGGGYYIKHSPKQQWYYARDQMPHEMLVFRIFDSQASAVPNTRNYLPKGPMLMECPPDQAKGRRGLLHGPLGFH